MHVGEQFYFQQLDDTFIRLIYTSRNATNANKVQFNQFQYFSINATFNASTTTQNLTEIDTALLANSTFALDQLVSLELPIVNTTTNQT